jgi:SAM-dependent methyltransferase
MRINIVILKNGAVHADCFAELAETLYRACVALGHDSSWDFDIFIQDATNIVLGWHQSPDDCFPPGSVIFNLEQLGNANLAYTDRLIALQHCFTLWDYSQKNIDALKAAGLTVPVELIRIGHMPQMTRIPKLENQGIDVLFYGSINERRAKVLNELKGLGLSVVNVFGVYGAGRDALIARSKVVLCMHYYDTNIFEIVRVSYLLSNAKAVVAEVGPDCEIEGDILNAVKGVPYSGLVEACQCLVEDSARRALFEHVGIKTMVARSQYAFLVGPLSRLPKPEPAPMRKLNLGSGKDYRQGYLNIDIDPAWNPDMVFDITKQLGGPLVPGSFQEIIAFDVLEHLPNLAQAMTNCLNLLEEGGVFRIIVPYDLSHGAWQDPTHVRAFNEKSWLYYTEWFWYMGWKESRFAIESLNLVLSTYGEKLKERGVPDDELAHHVRAVDSMELVLRKQALTPEEKVYGDQLRGQKQGVLPADIPVFIINRNRLYPLKALVDWLIGAGTKDIRIVDNDSTYPPLLAYYQNLPEQVTVIHMGVNAGPWVVWEHGLVDKVETPYIVTDADLLPAGCPTDLVEKMLRLLEAHPECGKVGVGLRIDNLPDWYKHKKEVIEWEAKFWWNSVGDDAFRAAVDTTFALYPPHAPFQNGPQNLRMNRPYCFEHLPWYSDETDLDEEEKYYREHADPRFSHWSFGGVRGMP